MLRAITVIAIVFFCGVNFARAKDLSAETLAIVHDVMSPYANKSLLPASGADLAAFNQSLDILNREKLLDMQRPTTLPLNLADKLGWALALGNRTSKFLAEVAAVRDAIVHQDDKAAAAVIQQLYVKMGRKAPEGESLDKLLASTRDTVGKEPQETERIEINRPDYDVLVEFARSAGKAKISVLNRNGPGGKPARVDFKGDVGTRPDPAGKDLQTVVTPNTSPDIITWAKSLELRARINGKWFDQNGVEYEISGEGGSITLTDKNPARTARAYVGTDELGLIRAKFSITKPDDMSPELPLNVRQQLAATGLAFNIFLSTLNDGTKLDGTWSSQNVTYSPDGTVVSVHDPYDVVLTLIKKPTEYHIAELKNTYKGWEQKKLDLQARVNLAKYDFEHALEEPRRSNERYEIVRADAAKALRASEEAAARYDNAVQSLNNYVPPESGKSADYLRLEKQRDDLTKRVDRLYDHINQNKDHIIPDSAFESYDRLKAELEQVEAAIVNMAKTLGFDAAHDRLVQEASKAFVKKTRAEFEFAGALVVQDSSHKRSDAAALNLAQAQEKLSQAELELANFSNDSIHIDGLDVQRGPTVYYQARGWDPSEVLNFMSGEIAQLGKVLAQATEARQTTRAEFLTAQNEASYAQMRLADGIMRSAIAQSVTETAFNIVDVVDKTVEAGPIGALGEGAKKVVEAVVLGPPSFYEPSLAPEIMTGDGGPFSDIRANVKDAMKYSAKRMAKSGVSSPTASYIINRYLLARDTRVYMELIGQTVQGSMQTGYRIVSESSGQAASKAFDAMQKARAGLKKAVDTGLFKNLAGLTQLSFKELFKKVATSPQAGKLAHSIGRDLAKMATKKVMAEYFEGVPLADYLAAEAEARMRTQIFLAASAAYWESYDDYSERVEERREILRQYDEKNRMQIAINTPFPEGTDLRIALVDAAGEPLQKKSHRVSVELGGKSARLEAGDTLVFRVGANDLVHDADGGVKLEVSVDE